MRSSKLFSFVLGLILGGGVAYLVTKKYSKISKEVEEQEDKEQKELEEAGITEEVLRTSSPAGEDNRSMIERIHNTVRHSTMIDEDVFNSTEALESETVVHVVESVFNEKYRQIDFIFEVPNYIISNERDSYKYPKTREYKEMIDNLSKKICERCLVRTFTKLEGYIVLNIGEEKRTVIKRVPSSWYEKYKNQRNDGFVEYYENFMKDKTGDMEKELLSKVIVKDDNTPVEFVDLLMTWRISVPVQRNARGNGINEINAIQCLNLIVDNAEAKREHGETVNFKNFLFHPFVENSVSDIEPSIINEKGVIENIEY